MGRGRMIVAVSLWALACDGTVWEPEVRPLPRLPSVPAQVESPEGTGAWLVPLDGSAAVMVYRWQLPPGAREGDVIVDGQVDRERTAEHHRALARQLADIEEKAERARRSGR